MNEYDSKIITKNISNPVEIFDLVDSTNNVLLNKINSQSGTVIIAHSQTSGKGRQGRKWISPPGNLYFSMLWQFNCSLSDLYGLSLVVGIAISRIIKRLGLEDIRLKWPNDVYLDEAKMGGILIETKQNKKQVQAVIGIGLNISNIENYRDEIGKRCVTLESALGREIDINLLVENLIIELNTILPQFEEQKFAAFIEEWMQLDTLNGLEVVYS